MKRHSLCWILVLLLNWPCLAQPANVRVFRGQGGGGRPVPGDNVPTDASLHITGGTPPTFQWITKDSQQMRWDVNTNGSLVSGQGRFRMAMSLEVNGGSFPGPGGGMLSPDGSEVEIGPGRFGPLQAYRRVYVNAKGAYCRWIDIFENVSPESITVGVKYTTLLTEPAGQYATSSDSPSLSKADWAFATGSGNDPKRAASVVHVFASPDSDTRPLVEGGLSADTLTYKFNITVAPGKPVALCFFMLQRPDFPAARQAMREFSLRKELALIPKPLRAILLNMPSSAGPSGTALERDDEADLVVLRNGDQIRGEISTSEYRLKTSLGELKLPAGKVVGLISISSEKDLVRLATTDGQVLLGEMLNVPLLVKLPGGTELKVAPRGMLQAAYRVSPDKPYSVLAQGPLATLHRGESLGFEPNLPPLEFLTEQGSVKISPADLQSLETDVPGGLHRMVFRNGSSLSGILSDARLKLKLTLGMPVELPIWQIHDIRFAPASQSDETLTRVKLHNGDVLLGKFTDASWTLQSDYGPIQIKPSDLAEAELGADGVGMIKAGLKNGSRVGGKLAEDYVTMQIQPGPTLRIFAGQIETITGGKTPGATSAPAVTPEPVLQPAPAPRPPTSHPAVN